ncbi:SAM-dependent methyltransferase [Nocardia brasiliensis]|uniref:SAM-dependent methyltransferase n=1 Tax=Nocardia brasiliensis TaxID=37326 RepID=UPI0004A6E373|nr:SAM-dependent methyltransferase [Nocardia brasiliensis]
MNTVEPLRGVGATAIGVAGIRARESERSDRLYDDPYARLFVEVARGAYLAPSAPPGSAANWATIEGLIDRYYERRTVEVRLVDDRVHAAIDSGVRQVVAVGAGLDSRAFRMSTPADLVWFELDLPDVFAFKERVLQQSPRAPGCHRRVVPADLRLDWVRPLLGAGFQPVAPTTWIEEGVIGYLANDDAISLATMITKLSAPGSTFDTAHRQVDENHPRYRELKELAFGNKTQSLAGLGSTAQQWLDDHGWDTEFRSWDELVRPLNRPAAAGTGNPTNGFIHATRT